MKLFQRVHNYITNKIIKPIDSFFHSMFGLDQKTIAAVHIFNYVPDDTHSDYDQYRQRLKELYPNIYKKVDYIEPPSYVDVKMVNKQCKYLTESHYNQIIPLVSEHLFLNLNLTTPFEIEPTENGFILLDLNTVNRYIFYFDNTCKWFINDNLTDLDCLYIDEITKQFNDYIYTFKEEIAWIIYKD